MASSIIDKTGKEYLVLTDKQNQIWERLSFRTSASDVILSSGKSVQDIAPSAITGTLAANTDTIKFTNSAITTTTSVMIFTSIFGINPVGMTIETGVVTLTFEPQNTNMDVKIVIF